MAETTGTPARARRRVELVAATEEHRRGVDELYADVFGGDYVKFFDQRRQWAFEDHAADIESHAWALVSEGRVVGFLGAIPQPYTIAGESIVAHTPSDFMVHPDVRFHGLKLMKRFFADCENCVTLDDIEATIEVTRFMGARVVDTVCQYSKVLDLDVVRSRVDKLRKLPDPITNAGSKVLTLADKAILRSGSEYRVIDAHSPTDAACAVAASDVARATIDRSERFFTWRYGNAGPHGESIVLLATDSSGEPAGYIIGLAAEFPRPTGHILDLQVADGHDLRAVTTALIAELTRRFRTAGSRSVRHYGLSAKRYIDEPLLKRLGFRVTSDNDRTLLVKLGDPELHALASRPSAWNFRLGDAEASHFLR